MDTWHNTRKTDLNTFFSLIKNEFSGDINAIQLYTNKIKNQIPSSLKEYLTPTMLASMNPEKMDNYLSILQQVRSLPPGTEYGIGSETTLMQAYHGQKTYLQVFEKRNGQFYQWL